MMDQREYLGALWAEFQQSVAAYQQARQEYADARGAMLVTESIVKHLRRELTARGMTPDAGGA